MPGEPEFHPFRAEEAATWLASRGCERDSDGAGTLADLYGTLNGQTVRREPAAIGFA